MVQNRLIKDRSTYQLILMDYKMPICNGCESTSLIRKFLSTNAPDLNQPLIICTTSFSGKEFEKNALVAGMDQFYTKPIFKSTLQKIMSKMNQHQQQRGR